MSRLASQTEVYRIWQNADPLNNVYLILYNECNNRSSRWLIHSLQTCINACSKVQRVHQKFNPISFTLCGYGVRVTWKMTSSSYFYIIIILTYARLSTFFLSSSSCIGRLYGLHSLVEIVFIRREVIKILPSPDLNEPLHLCASWSFRLVFRNKRSVRAGCCIFKLSRYKTA